MSNGSPRWAVWKRMVLRRSDGDAYMTRWRIVQTPFFAVYLHRFDAPDPGLDLHDHPWPFVTLVLSGGYLEEVEDIRTAVEGALVAEGHDAFHPDTPPLARGELRAWYRRSIHTIGLTTAHRITQLIRTPTWTLVVRGRISRDWGFYEPTGWVDSATYSDARRDLATEMA